MTATIELDERLVDEAKKITGITEDGELVNMAIGRFVKGQELLRSMLKERESIRGKSFSDGHDPETATL
jgi:Arc/MetJ family transcription regulator